MATVRQTPLPGFPAGPAQQDPGTVQNIWGQQQQITQRYPSLTRNVRCDVCVIGGGIAGLSTAYRLAKAGKHVCVLEARVCGAGSSGCSLGMLSQLPSGLYKSVEATAGSQKARTVAQAHSSVVSWVEGVAKTEGIECDFHRVPAFVFESKETRRGVSPLHTEFNACTRIGLMQAKLENIGCGSGIPTGTLRQTLTLPENANLHPVKFIQGLAEAVVNAGGRIFEGTRAKGGIVTGPYQGVVQIMGSGLTVEARDAVVLATHSPINRDQLWVHDRQLPKQSYTLGLQVPKGSVQPGHFYDISSGHQVRLAPGPDPENEAVLLVRGGTELYGSESSGRADPYAKLEAWARSMYPQALDVVSKWSSHDYYPADILGLYGKDPLSRLIGEEPPNYILTGHGGQDFTGAVIGSEVVANDILQLPNPWAAAYEPSRFLLGFTAAAKYALELSTYFSRIGIYLLKHVVPRNLSDIVGAINPSAVEGQLERGQGMVVQHGLRKVALARDKEGQLHKHSALCTHLGCCVGYNALTNTFDCPCHGSAYTAQGQCIHGPAVADLEDLA